MPLKEDELMHYGVLGMHWGIRRYQPYPKTGPDGKFVGKLKKYKRNADKGIKIPHRIPKGTKMYRMTTVTNENPKGSTYVTFRKQDRNFYQMYSRGQHPNQKTYEMQMTAKEDINVPSVKEQNDVVKEIMKDPKQIAKAKKAVEEFALRSRTQGYNLNDAKKAADVLDKAEKKIGYKEGDDVSWRVTDKAFEMRNNETGKVASIPMKNASGEQIRAGAAYRRGKSYAERITSTQAGHDLGYLGLMYNKQLKEKVMNRLSKRGYNAMVDQAGIGVIKNEQGKIAREGYETLIIFDREKTLSTKGSKEITDADARKRSIAYNKDFDGKNRYRN